MASTQSDADPRNRPDASGRKYNGRVFTFADGDNVTAVTKVQVKYNENAFRWDKRVLVISSFTSRSIDRFINNVGDKSPNDKSANKARKSFCLILSNKNYLFVGLNL